MARQRIHSAMSRRVAVPRETRTVIEHNANAFVHFTIASERCPGVMPHEVPEIWLDYGGNLKAGAIKEGRTRARDQALTIEGVTKALVRDSSLEGFDAAVHNKPGTYVTATLVGRYFGRKAGAVAGGPREWRGFGMWGMYSLLVNQQVVSFPQ